MSRRPFLRRFAVRGVFWRQYLNWGIHNTPFQYEPIVMLAYSIIFLALAAPARRAISTNLKSIKPGSSSFVNFFRALRVFWNFAWSIADAARFEQDRTAMDWEFEHSENLDKLIALEGGAIVLTAHMGNYELGSHAFTERCGRKLTTVRIPEVDPETQRYVATARDQVRSSDLSVGYNTQAEALVLELIDALDRGDIVAIQGDRVPANAGPADIDLFGLPASIPAGPFVLALATRKPIFPIFVIRTGRRRYKVLTGEPIECRRVTRDRNLDMRAGMIAWRDLLEETIRLHWHQWYMFEPIRGSK